MSTRLIGHLDADCFYVSAERVRFPHLRGLPVGILSNQGACVIAKSYELKACGVTTGMPIWEAQPLCPNAIYVKRDFRWYEVLSGKMLALLKEESPAVEYYSIDEFFFDASRIAPDRLQQRLLDEVGVPVSVGISLSRTLAKLASDIRKPFGCSVLTERSEINDFLGRLPATDIAGIAKKSGEKLAEHGIQTCLDLAHADRKLIQRLLTVKGEAIWYELNGDPVTPITTVQPPRKRIGRGGSLGAATDDPRRILGWAIRNVERLVEELNFHDLLTRRLTLSLEYKSGVTWGGRSLLPDPTADFGTLAYVAKAIVGRSPHDGEVLEGMHVDADMLSTRRRRQLRFFDNSDPCRETIARVKQLINVKVGRFAIRSADTLQIDDIYEDDTSDYDSCDIHGKTCF